MVLIRHLYGLTVAVASARAAVVLPPYRNASLCIDQRLDDLLQRMTLEEKAGQLFVTVSSMGVNGTVDSDTTSLITEKYMSHFNLQTSGIASDIATWSNAIQRLALSTRLGIPVTISTDPRHAYGGEVAGATVSTGSFSQWTGTLGFAALRSPDLVRRFAEVAREEYTAVGLRAALSPQVDVTTEPRWARSGQTYGEDSNLTSALAVAYIQGFQGETIGRSSVTTVTKHFPGGGPARDSNDSHWPTGKNNIYPGGFLDYHLQPFKSAIAAGARQVMPSYAKPIGLKYEEVGMAFNKGIITDLLKDELNFGGIVLSDWGLISPFSVRGEQMVPISWGVENLTDIQKVEKILNAGTDQFGGETRTELVVELVKTGRVSMQRIDSSVRKVLQEKFLLGLFDQPLVDAAAADSIVGNAYFRRLAGESQRRSYTLLKNDNNTLPLSLSAHPTIYLSGVDAIYFTRRNITVVNTTAEADFAIVRLSTPYETRGGPFEQVYHEGRLDFSATEKARIAAITSAVPTIVDIYLDRPAVIPELAENTAALLGNYGASPDAMIDIIFNIDSWRPEGRLPFDLPRTMAAVEQQLTDVPFDTANPVYRFNHGLSYVGTCSGSKEVDHGKPGNTEQS